MNRTFIYFFTRRHEFGPKGLFALTRRNHILLGITSFWSGNPRSNSGIHSQKSDSNHYFGVDSTIIWEWIQLQIKYTKTQFS